MNRPSEDDVLLSVAATWATRGTCSRGRTGAVVALRGRTLSSGYNGAPAGMPHCEHSCDCGDIPHYHAPDCRSLRPCQIAVHAEANAVAFAARHGIALEGGTLYTLFSPCRPCAQLIINAGIVRVVTTDRRPGGETSVGAGEELLRDAGVDVAYLPEDSP